MENSVLVEVLISLQSPSLGMTRGVDWRWVWHRY